MKQLKYIGAVLLALTMFTACEKEFDAIPEEIATVPEGSAEAWAQTVTIKELIENFDTKEGEFTIDTIDSPNDIVVRGRIITDDRAGNVYKYFVIQSLEDDHTCLKVSVDAGSLSGMLPIGQVVAIRCNGLVLGRYASAPQLGVRGYRNDNKVREEPGRIPYTLAMKHIQKIGKPDPSKIVVEEMTLKQITELDKYGYFKIVKIKNAYFTGYYYNDQTQKHEKLNDEVYPFPTDGQGVTTALAKYALNPTFAPATYDSSKKYNIGFPRSREIADDSGNTTSISISTSEYARFADRRLPVFGPDNRGDITAIVGWFKDDKGDPGSWQLTIRSLDNPFADLEGFEFPEQ